MTTWRELCRELIDSRGPDYYRALERARKALADGPAVPEGREPASVSGEPSDEEIMGLMPEEMHADLAAAARAMAEQTGTDSIRVKGLHRIMLNRHVVDLARTVLARWGRPAPAPAGDVMGPTYDDLSELCLEHGLNVDSWSLEKFDALWEVSRAVLARWGSPNLAEIRRSLGEPAERQGAPVPVAVSERLPGDALCWWYEPDEDDDPSGYGGCWTLLRISGAVSFYTHWLPAHALPLPAGEVDP